MKIIDDILYEMQEYLNQEVIDTDKETISDVGVGIERCMEIVKRIANEQDNDWIPCSKRLPENGVEVLVCKQDGILDFDIYEYEYEDWKFNSKNHKNTVTAWQQLPEPYKED